MDYKESRAPKNWCFWTVVLEKTLESPLDCKEIKPVHPKGDQSWIFSGRTDAKAETLILWTPDVKSWLIWKNPDAGKDLRQEETGTTEDEMVGWHHQLNGHEFEEPPRVGDGQVGLVSMGSQSVRQDWATKLTIFPGVFHYISWGITLVLCPLFCYLNILKHDMILDLIFFLKNFHSYFSQPFQHYKFDNISGCRAWGTEVIENIKHIVLQL